MSTELPPEEDVVLQRYRQLASEQPPAALDARIRSAARAQVAQPRPSWLARLGQGLSAASLAQRGSLAFGSLASVALVLGLVWQGLPPRQPMMEQSAMAPAPVTDPPALPAAPAPEQPVARPAPAAPAAGALAARPAPREQARQMAAAKAQADVSLRARMGESGSPTAGLDAALSEILRLREAGRAEEAEQRLATLRERHSEAWLRARLAELEHRPEAGQP